MTASTAVPATGFQALNRNDVQEIWRKDHDHFLHPWTHFDSFKKDGSLIMAAAEGAYVYDASGKRYLDGIGGLWCVNIGYGRREIAEAISRQALQLAYFNPFVDTTNIPAAELAAKLAELAPGSLNHVFFTCGGSTANDTAVRLIQYYQSRRGKRDKVHVICRRDGYHGSTYLTGSMSGKPADRSPNLHFITDFVHHVSSPNVYRRPEGMSEEAFCDQLVAELEAKILELGADKVAAFFAEPVLGAGGVIVPPKGYHQKTRELCRKLDVIYVSDEVVTGFGRLGHFFASKDVFGIEPDIIICAKGLTSGYQPLGACIYSDAIHEVISAPDPDGWFTNGYTYSGHPIACAAGLANIELMEREDLCGHVREVGPYLMQQLNTLRDLPIVGDVRGHHFMMCVENVADPATKELFPDEVNIGKRIADHCERLGLIVRPIGALNIISPPLVLTRAQVDELVGILRQSIEATMKDLKAEGFMKA
ncbi:aminotransferase [Dongia soli]|uniref:Aminotransferase n=1 Tax=Dongia soli TaxID=600628 RepID=A0ABU5E5X6_9PROT|nr:aminotransferase [Dongia soli]MDY0881682.1 aminotransferase [Dongia soli]